MAEHNNQALQELNDPFEDYFRRVDSDEDGRISAIEAFNFLKGSNLSVHAVYQIILLACNGKFRSMGREEFKDALKIVSLAHQCQERGEELSITVASKEALLGGGSADSPPKKIPAPHIDILSPDQQLDSSWICPSYIIPFPYTGPPLSKEERIREVREGCTRTLVHPNGKRDTYTTSGFIPVSPTYSSHNPCYTSFNPSMVKLSLLPTSSPQPPPATNAESADSH